MYLDNSLLVNKKKLEGIEKDITCPICQGIINDPYFCIKCQNNFCCKCIKQWEQNNKSVLLDAIIQNILAICF